jgi:hypothetical protein
VASYYYPVNVRCAHPDCDEPATVHHIFPRSLTKSDSYFVEITEEVREDGGAIVYDSTKIVPHAVGLCGSGTTGHHGDVEEHRAWIRLEDGVFVWYDRHSTAGQMADPTVTRYAGVEGYWESRGPLNPQPGSVEGKPKKKKSGEEKRKRKTISLRVPADSEDGAAVYDEYLGRVKERLVVEGLYVTVEKIPAYEATIAAWDDWLNS